MTWLYRLQQRIAITKTESTVLAVLALLFAGGLVARTVQNAPPALSPDVYQHDDQLFHQGAASFAPDSTDTAPSLEAVPSSTREKVDLNAASFERLQQLNGVGPATARRILDYRERRGGFRRVAELQRVRGIGPKTLAGLRDQATVR